MAILDEIDRRRKQDPEFDELYGEAENPESNLLDDRPFVKNIENVQGDERDIVIFSVGYARDPDGNLHIRFGSLNQEGGENRLNVAVTRARKEIVVVCSIDPDELRTDAAKNSGPKRLKDYLRYAKAISENNRQSAGVILASLNNGFRRENSASGFLFESPFEEMVHDHLTQLGYTVDTQVGYSGYKIDLAVVHPDEPFRYIIAIECDGATFHSAKSTRERDVMRQEFLESRGWVVERIWSRNWWRNPRGEIERIRDRIEGLRGQSAGRITKE
jgi:very-short-patch-repair endonuclease